jgi:ubiquinone/menaquinone biosynthesis C-methylase UbiE
VGSPHSYEPWELRQAIADSYSQAAGKYEEHILPIFLPMARNLVDALPIDKASRVLDLATGGGAVLDALLEAEHCHVVAADLAPGALLAARQRHPDVEMVLLDLESSPPFKRQTFDFITCSFGLNHIADPEASLRRLLPLLKPGGRIGLTSWRQVSSAAPLARLFDEAIRETTGRKGLEWGESFDKMIGPALRRLRTPTGLRRLLHDSGYRRIRIHAHTCHFSFETMQDYVRYRLAWGSDMELAAPLGPEAVNVLTSKLESQSDQGTEMSWERTYYVAIGSGSTE